MADDAGDATFFFRYQDDRGRDVVTNDYASIPPAYREHAALFDPGARPAPVVHVPAVVGGVHLPSAAVGAGAALVVVAAVGLARGRRRGRRLLLRAAGLAAGVALLGALYFGWVMRSAGLGDGGLVAFPADAVHQARAAAAAADRATQAQAQAVDALDR